MNEPFGLALYEAGLLQFGRFVDDSGARPFQHHLDMLASYPALLSVSAKALAPNLYGVDRLLCAADCTPLATALALETGVPLVIGRGSGHDGVRDFVGAYDIGHPAALVTHTLDEAPAVLIHHAGRFGLDVRLIVALLDAGPCPVPLAAVSALRLSEVTASLVSESKLPAGLGRAVDMWLREQASRLRPG
jgi:hypothetical protein